MRVSATITVATISCSCLLLLLLQSPVNGQGDTFALDAVVRSISVDYDNDRFLLDGQPFRYISGSFHYFRAVPESWRRIIRLMKAAGLNAISTYVEWSLHNPHDGVYDWTGMADLERFVETCKEEGMFVLLRPGPYICAERDNGGFPVWLLKKYPGIKLRTRDPDYLREVAKWYSVLMPKMQPHLNGRGGNIILVQVENEYGSTKFCDHNYTSQMRDISKQYVNDDALLYTTDGASYDSMVRCGHINGTVQSVDFGTVYGNISNQFKLLRKYYPRGPLINSEFYVGWLSHWQESFPITYIQDVARTLDAMLREGVNVNMYMFFGGTNFGYTSGANVDTFKPQTTSYDYGAPLTEAGDVTSKYWAIRNVTSKYVTITTPVPENTKKLNLPPIALDESSSLFLDSLRAEICNQTRTSKDPLTFEDFDQKGGLIIYESYLPKNLHKDPDFLTVNSIQDRAMVYIDRSYIGILDRAHSAHKIAFSPNNGQKLQLVVEDQGRLNYHAFDMWKGVDGVKIGNHSLLHWNSTACPLNDGDKLNRIVRQFASPRRRSIRSTFIHGPTFFIGEITLREDQVLDTFIDMTGWTKGVAFVNGHNLGRYWATVKPQRTLYLPKEFLKTGGNHILLLEYQSASINRTVTFIDHALLK